ncbi:hypothetical protein CCP3SC5AM1_150020 [Gammaproteobacteria bacterium]
MEPGVKKSKVTKKNQGIRLIKPQNGTIPESGSDVLYLDVLESTITTLRGQLGEAFEREQQQQVRLEHYERGVAELWSITVELKKELIKKTHLFHAKMS